MGLSCKKLMCAVFPTGRECSIRSCSWSLCCCLQLCTHTHNHTPPYTLIIIPGQHCLTATMHLLLLLNIATPLWWCSGDCWENSKLLSSHPLRLSIAQLALINWEWIHDAWVVWPEPSEPTLPHPPLHPPLQWASVESLQLERLDAFVRRPGRRTWERLSDVAFEINGIDTVTMCVVCVVIVGIVWGGFPVGTKARRQEHKHTLTETHSRNLCSCCK